MQPREVDAAGLLVAVANVEGLYGLTGRALHQVVEGSEDDEAIGVRIALETDIVGLRALSDQRERDLSPSVRALLLKSWTAESFTAAYEGVLQGRRLPVR